LLARVTLTLLSNVFILLVFAKGLSSFGLIKTHDGLFDLKYDLMRISYLSLNAELSLFYNCISTMIPYYEIFLL